MLLGNASVLDSALENKYCTQRTTLFIPSDINRF
ncbi:MAG: hypothetical protein FKGGLIKP_00713 [Sodalis sp. Fse]|nr:MAG: hypothetical protein FKGGLIKP_00713 [Sodalis sp. Fse]UVK79278.1 MAG: hypothetical protein IGNPGNKH_00769 [Sodalis sp. Ffu]